MNNTPYHHAIGYCVDPPLGKTHEWASRDGSAIDSGDNRSMFARVEKDHELAPLADAIRAAFFLDLNPRRMRDYVPKASTQLGAEGQNLSAAVWQLCQERSRKQDLSDGTLRFLGELTRTR